MTFTLEIPVIINSKFVLLQDNKDYTFNNFGLWLNQITKQSKKESLIRKERCEICNSKDVFEGHHIAGKKHDHRQITACLVCHRWLSDMQKIWDKRWEKENLSENLREAFFFMGLHDILVLKSKKTRDSLYEEYAYSLIEDISKLLKQG